MKKNFLILYETITLKNFPTSKNENKLTLKKFLIFREMEHFSPKLQKLLSFLVEPLKVVHHSF